MREQSESGRDQRPGEGPNRAADYPGPSTGAPPGALEGSIREGDGEDAESRRTEGSKQSTTGAGAEAAEGLHGAGGRGHEDTSSVSGRPVGRDASGGIERAGSEPIDRETEHKGSYGGEGGNPRTSSDQRESPRDEA